MYAQQGGFRQPNVGMNGSDSMMGGGFSQTQGSVMDNSRYMMNESPVMEVMPRPTGLLCSDYGMLSWTAGPRRMLLPHSMMWLRLWQMCPPQHGTVFRSQEGSAYSGSPGIIPSQQGSGRSMYSMPGGGMGMSPYGMPQSDQPPSQQAWRGMPGDSSDTLPMRGLGNRVYGSSPGAVMPDGGGSMYQSGLAPQQPQRWSSGGSQTPSAQNRTYMPMGWQNNMTC